MQNLRAWDPPRVGGHELLGLLGAGGMGEVFLGRAPDGRLAAVKVVHAALARDHEFRVRFGREVAAATKVSGRWTASVIDADPDAPRPWLATEYVLGPSLAAAVAELGPLPEPTVRIIAARLAQALQAIHGAGLVHRDLKPSNVLLAADGPRVIDFGIARALDTTKLTLTGHVVGTPAYMAPEQVTEGDVGPAADVFALGSLLYFAATGHGPFGDTSTVATLRRVAVAEPDLAPVASGLRELLGQCMAKDPSARPTAEQLAPTLLDDAVTLAGGSWLPLKFSTLVDVEKAALEHVTLAERPAVPAPEAGTDVMAVPLIAPPRPAQSDDSQKRTNLLFAAAGAIVIALVAVLAVTLLPLGDPTATPSAATAPTTSAASPSTTPGNPSPSAAATSRPPVQQIGLVPSVVPGWIAALSTTRNAAYDVPRSWVVSSPGRLKGFDDNAGTRVLMSGVAEFMPDNCSGNWARAFAGVSGSRTSRLPDAAAETAQLWAKRYSADDGRPPQVHVGRAEPITVRGVAASHVATTVVVPVDGPCDPPRAVIHTVALRGNGGQSVVWVLLADQDVADIAADADIRQMITTIRQAGMQQKCLPNGDIVGTWC